MTAQRIIHPTADGSDTIAVPSLGVTYHSKHGAIQESLHVYIETGMRYRLSSDFLLPPQKEPDAQNLNALSTANRPPLRILEMGWGTGLNALLTLKEAIATSVPIWYYAVERYPLPPEQVAALNYTSLLNEPTLESAFFQMHDASWNEEITLHPLFTLHKADGCITTTALPGMFHLIYYDAFDPGAQPELWQTSLFSHLYEQLLPQGALVTYCCKSTVRRALQQAGFATEKLPGPPGKREILRAVRPPLLS